MNIFLDIVKKYFYFWQTHTLILFCSVFSFLTSLVLIPFIINRCNKYGWYDKINARKIHTGNIPRLGGIGFVTAFSLFAVIYSVIEKDANLTTVLPFIIAGLIIFLFGLIDDFMDLNAKYKLAVQIIAAAIIVLSGYRFKNVGTFVFPLWFSYVITFCWIIGIINSYNLIDGIDGLCGGLSSFAIFAIGIIYSFSASHTAALCYILVGAIIGFLIYNNPTPKAKIFMGDGGSQFLGFMIAALPLYQSTVNFEYNKFFIMLNLVAIPMIDTIAAIWRRLREHRGIMSPDKLHLHHKLINLGLSSRQVLIVILSVQVCLDIVSVSALYLRGFTGFIMLLITYIVIIILFCIIHYLNYYFLSKKTIP